MRCTLFILLLCSFNCIVPVFTICTVSKYERGFGNRLQCSNVTLATVSNQTSTNVSSIMILNSSTRYIPEKAFLRYAKTLQSLHINYCNVLDINSDAFDQLVRLKKLSLSKNKISRVRGEWFKDLVYLEQLDLSFNQITELDPAIFDRLSLLKRLDVRENSLTCFDGTALPGGIDKVYFHGNPLTFICRGKLTLWMREHGVKHKTEQDTDDGWLDKLLWSCATSDPDVAKSEVLMKECVILNLFNQLRTGLTTAESYPLSTPQECKIVRNSLTDCIAAEAQTYQQSTNGNWIENLLLYLYQAKSSI